MLKSQVSWRRAPGSLKFSAFDAVAGRVRCTSLAQSPGNYALHIFEMIIFLPRRALLARALVMGSQITIRQASKDTFPRGFQSTFKSSLIEVGLTLLECSESLPRTMSTSLRPSSEVSAHLRNLLRPIECSSR